MKWIYKIFNHDKIDEMQRTIDIYRERNEQLEKENREYKGYKLKYEVTKLYVEDDDALIEIFELAEKAEKYKQNSILIGRNAAQQQLAGGMLNALAYGAASYGGQGGLGQFGGLGGRG